MNGAPATMTKELGTVSMVPVVGTLVGAGRPDSRTSELGAAIENPEASVVPVEPMEAAVWLLAIAAGAEP